MNKNIKPIIYNKSEWEDGPWQYEPDRVEFEHKGYPCLIIRTPMGHLCGYVAVKPEHPMYGKDYNDVNVEVHGGLTYGNHCNGHICHVPKKGEPDNVYWFGFDHAHAWDYSPYKSSLAKQNHIFDKMPDEEYRDIEYVTKGVKSLAEQLKAMEN